jgi:hypothetical protein
MTAPLLADALDLGRWAEQVESRPVFPTLIRRLIRQTNDDISKLEMRDAEGIGFEGYDGEVIAGRATPMVPLGHSVWELGVGKDPRGKAQEDYAKRSKDPRGVDPLKTTFVFATPQQWDDKEGWASEKRAEKIWADVQVYDADNISIAFETAPAVHYWFSDLAGKPAGNVRMLEDWWIAFASASSPALRPALVLAGRADDAARLVELLRVEVGRTAIASPTPDDTLAFVAAVLDALPEPAREQMLSRAVVVHDAPSMRILDRTAKLLILLPFEDGLLREAALVRNNHVIHRVDDKANANLALRPVDRDAFAGALTEEGVAKDRAQDLAAAAYRSLVAFQNAAPARGAPARRWGANLVERVVRRALLVGGWNDLRSGDVGELERLLARDYATALEALRPLSAGEDPLFASVGPTWSLTSAATAWSYAAPRIEQRDLQDLERTLQAVLGAVDPALDLPVGDRWKATLYDKTSPFSSNLRSGLALTLALAGADSSLPKGSTTSFADWSAGMVAQLLRRANDDRSGNLWQSLSDVLPLLGEAAPDVLLTQVDAGLAGPQPVLRTMFTDGQNDLFSSSPHTGLLWALERLAWSSDHAARVAAALARLSEIDPGGKLSNRPARSLDAMFRPWLPQTSLPLARRLTVLDALERDHPDVSWSLLIGLLPRQDAVGMYANAPEVRVWKPAGADDPMPADYAQAFAAVAERLIARVAREPQRWPELIEHLPELPQPERDRAIAALEAIAREDGS